MLVSILRDVGITLENVEYIVNEDIMLFILCRGMSWTSEEVVRVVGDSRIEASKVFFFFLDKL